ncbi:phosphotransferase [Streptomyces europaeiscabiei]|uniref:phosphotransferase n=1 Tax=Streptomyces europaeiscabiei TaxID=146819 RepID=UPI0029A3293A|nr:phosphotransferase [Streptomyces europaeiscabiei]MDX3715363.1 phosphotransferase [Streptomyces europaeiscabiei]MDX3866047.1 phosphotransferase [Streptomyces europaeiscabiei]MDX3874906.1 phosphotransferase [Streptomyces europaeiscabiei]
MLVEDDSDGRRYVLKATLAEGGAEAVHAEHLAVRHFRSQDPGLVVPEAIPRLQDHDLVDRTGLRMRLLGWVPGAPLGSVTHLSPTALRGLGRLAARSVTALAGFDHPGLHRHSSDCSRYLPRDASGRAVFWSLVCRQEAAVASLYRAGPGGAGRRRGRAPTAARAGVHPTPLSPPEEAGLRERLQRQVLDGPA